MRSTQVFERMSIQLGAAKLVEQVLQLIPPDEENDEQFWVKDCQNNDQLVENLSYSKMLYEMDHCNARYFDQGENMLMPYPICASAGKHSENDRKREI